MFMEDGTEQLMEYYVLDLGAVDFFLFMIMMRVLVWFWMG